MQALDRTAPVLPMMPAVPGRQTHDYVRQGTTSLFADVLVLAQHRRTVVRRTDQPQTPAQHHRSVAQIENDVTAWIAAWNEDPRPFIWTKTADEILASLARYLTRLNQSISDSGHRGAGGGPCGVYPWWPQARRPNLQAVMSPHRAEAVPPRSRPPHPPSAVFSRRRSDAT